MHTAATKSATWLLIALLATAALLAGCGQKGPLYLPDDSTQAQKKKSTDTPTAP